MRKKNILIELPRSKGKGGWREMNIFPIINSMMTTANSATRNGWILTQNEIKKNQKPTTYTTARRLDGTICDNYADCKEFEGTIEKTTDIMGYECKEGYCEKYDTCKFRAPQNDEVRE